jgi:glycosyltransferase involved in cell wall biosynthesis
MKILHVIPSLEYSGVVMQLLGLARGLPPGRMEAWVCVLGGEGPCSLPLLDSPVTVDTLGWTRWLDVGALWQLRRLVRFFAPDLTHAWGLSALRAVYLAAGRTAGRLVVSKPLPPRGGPNRWDRWLLARSDVVVAGGPAEAARCRALGLDDRIAIVPPAAPERRSWAGGRAPALPASRSRFVLCAGPLEPHKGFGDAIWGLDILRYVDPGLNLMLLGTGSDRPRLERFVRGLGMEPWVHFAGDRADVPGILRQAALVWVPSRAEGGVTFALEAMVAGRAVIASCLPGLAEVVRDGETGVLVPPGHKVALARQTRRLLEDARRCQAMGAAGRRRVSECFQAGDLVRRFTALYHDLAPRAGVGLTFGLPRFPGRRSRSLARPSPRGPARLHPPTGQRAARRQAL